MNLKVCLCTTPSEEIAQQFANKWIQNKLAACVNILPKIQSIYHYDGKLKNDSESLMIVKTSESGAQKIKALLKEDHPYECPEWVELSASDVEQTYLNWVLDNSP